MSNTTLDGAPHTPGPWMVTHELRETDETVCDLVNNTWVVVQSRLGDWNADAALIAAAPDLLQACKALVDARDGLVAGLADNTERATAMARYAIKKALGQ
jgi:hypothetical protein